MGTVAVIGESPRVDGFGLAGARVFPAATPAEVLDAWLHLHPDVDVVILTPTAAAQIDIHGIVSSRYRVVVPT